MNTKNKNLPTIEDLLANHFDWLLEAVNTKEASRILSIPETTLITWRSRSGGGTLRYFSPSGTRLVRYIRLEIFRFLFSGNHKKNTFDEGVPIEIPMADNDNEEES